MNQLKRKVRHLKRLIESEYARRWTAATLAAAAGLSIAEMRSEFPQYHGKSALNHLRDVRLRRAAELLVAGKSVSETASVCGFVTCGNLGRTFHKSTGIFPSHYRFKTVGWKLARPAGTATAA